MSELKAFQINIKEKFDPKYLNLRRKKNIMHGSPIKMNTPSNIYIYRKYNFIQ